MGGLPLIPHVAALGLDYPAPFPHLRLESQDWGPAACLSTGRAMPPERVERLWRQGMHLGARLQRPVLLTECVPGGTTTAQAALTALGIAAGSLISGSAQRPPQTLKRSLVAQGLRRADLPKRPSPSLCWRLSEIPSRLLQRACWWPPGSRFSWGVVVRWWLSWPWLLRPWSKRNGRPSVSALCSERRHGWRMNSSGPSASLPWAGLLDRVGQHFGVSLCGLASGVRFPHSRHRVLRDYERGYVKEGVGAGALLLLAQLQGHPSAALVEACERVVDRLQSSP